MDDEERIIHSGRFKGKKIELASTAGIELFEGIAREFMLQVFNLEAGDYLITDESTLSDFAGVDDMQIPAIAERVRRLYGFDLSEVEDETLLNVFIRIHGRHLGADDDI
jgi:hypothetical protein